MQIKLRRAVKDSTIEDLVVNGYEEEAIDICEKEGMTTSDAQGYLMAIENKLSK